MKVTRPGVMAVSIAVSIVLSIAALTTACTPMYPTPGTPISPVSETPLDIETQQIEGVESIIEEKDAYTIAVHRPVTRHAAINATLETLTEGKIAQFKKDIGPLLSDLKLERPYELHMGYRVSFNSYHYYSVLFTKHIGLRRDFSKGEHIALTFDAFTGEPLKLKGVFDGVPATRYLPELSTLARKYLFDRHRMDSDFNPKEIRIATEPSELKFQHFLLSKVGLQFIFSESNFPKTYRVTIPYSEFTGKLPLNPILAEELSEMPLETEAQGNAPSPHTPIHDADVILPPPRGSAYGDKAPTLPLHAEEVKRIALTFEDGPHPLYTPLILDSLKSRGVPATFFMLGQRAEEYPGLVKRVFAEKHLICNHSYDHPQLPRLSIEAAMQQIEETQDILQQITGVRPLVYRPPYGIYNGDILEAVNLPAVLWSIDVKDLLYHDPDYMKTYILDHAFDGAIISLHDTQPGTAQAISGIIDALQDQGYTLVTVETLLRESPGKKIAPRVYSRGVE